MSEAPPSLCSTEHRGPLTTEAQQIRVANDQVKSIERAIEMAMKGRRVRIVSNYNGQPHGRSKPSQRGQESEIECIHLDPAWGPSLKLKDRDLYLRLDEVEFL